MDEHSSGAKGPSIQEWSASSIKELPPLRSVFMGTPDFAATILNRLFDARFVHIDAVYTQPDRPAGRGNKRTPSPVKRVALDHGIPVHQPLHFGKDTDGNEAYALLKDYKPDVLIVAAYGLILPQRVLDIPRYMPVNVHASLLPRYRGAAPIQRAIMGGECVTGITIMRMEAGLDSGPILMQRAVGIGIDDTSGTLHDELAHEGADLLCLALQRLLAGTLHFFSQDDSQATYASKLLKCESSISLAIPAQELHAHIRGLNPWPGANLLLYRNECEPLPVSIKPGIFPMTESMRERCEAFFRQQNTSGGPACATTTHKISYGSIVCGRIVGLLDNSLLITCGDGCYALTKLKPANRKIMDAAAFYNGYLAASPEAYFGTFDPQQTCSQIRSL